MNAYSYSTNNINLSLFGAVKVLLQKFLLCTYLLVMLVWINNSKEDFLQHKFTIVFDPGGYMRTLMSKERFPSQKQLNLLAQKDGQDLRTNLFEERGNR